jgi:hypothetical protein
MKAIIPLILVLSATAGCATQGTVPRDQGSNGSSFDAAASAPPAAIAFPSQDQDMGPRIIIPTTGGAPVIGIPLGGNIYLPVTGGEPVVGIPTAP